MYNTITSSIVYYMDTSLPTLRYALAFLVSCTQGGRGRICGERQHGRFYITPPPFSLAKFLDKSRVLGGKGLLSPPHTTTPVGEKLPLVLSIWTYVANVPLLGHF